MQGQMSCVKSGAPEVTHNLHEVLDKVCQRLQGNDSACEITRGATLTDPNEFQQIRVLIRQVHAAATSEHKRQAITHSR